ncbi:MAG: esterase, partial [Bermanella sp.]
NLDAINHCYEDLCQAPDGVSFQGPTLFIKGENSAYIQTSHGTAMQRLFPAHQLNVITDTGHWLHAEKPAAFNTLVFQFLEK